MIAGRYKHITNSDHHFPATQNHLDHPLPPKSNKIQTNNVTYRQAKFNIIKTNNTLFFMLLKR